VIKTKKLMLPCEIFRFPVHESQAPANLNERSIPPAPLTAAEGRRPAAEAEPMAGSKTTTQLAC